MSTKNYSSSDRRKSEILSAAMRLAERKGYQQVTRDEIAVEAGCAQGSVTRYFPTMQHTKRAIVGQALATRNLKILAQALAADDPRAKRMPDDLRTAVIDSLR